MKKIAIYPGSFDPITNGHIDIIIRASKIFDKLIIGITQNNKKSPFLKINDRVKITKESLKNINNIEVLSFDNLLVDFADKKNVQVIIRGLRAISDFEHEFQLAGMNKSLNHKIETLFMIPSEKYANISSSIVREIFLLGGDVNLFVPKPVENLLKNNLTK
jgi:pantetheine-phosphate adenylyltransferase